jgi:hypothetical protein
MEVSGQLDAPAALPPGKEPTVPFGQEAGWLENRSGRYGEEKHLNPTGYGTQVVQPVAIPTELSRGSLPQE